MPWRETVAELARARAEVPGKVAAPDGTLFGIYTPPAPDAPPAGLCAIHLTRPRAHRNRNWIHTARWLAARGFAAFRFDYHGTGDSGGASGWLDPNAPYRDDVGAVMRHLRGTHGQTRFVLTGSCFDARTALASLLEEPDAVAGVAFVAAPLTTLEDMAALGAAGKDWSHLLKALRNPSNWKSLANADRWKHMARVLGGIAKGTAAREPGGEVAAAAPAPASAAGVAQLHPSFLAAFEALCRSRARALFLYGEDDPEARTFELALRELWPGLEPSVAAGFDVDVWPGVVHGGFLEVRRQQEIVSRVRHWVLALHPQAAAAETLRATDAPAAPARAPTPNGAERPWTSD